MYFQMRWKSTLNQDKMTPAFPQNEEKYYNLSEHLPSVFSIPTFSNTRKIDHWKTQLGLHSIVVSLGLQIEQKLTRWVMISPPYTFPYTFIYGIYSWLELLFLEYLGDRQLFWQKSTDDWPEGTRGWRHLILGIQNFYS